MSNVVLLFILCLIRMMQS